MQVAEVKSLKRVSERGLGQSLKYTLSLFILVLTNVVISSIDRVGSL
jgi:hypothetical protein